MAYDEDTAEGVRQLLSERSDVEEKPIVGGALGFMVSGHLCCGISSRGLMVRVGPAAADEAILEPHVKPLMIGERRAEAFIVVEPDGYQSASDLGVWVERGLRFVATLGVR